MSFMLNPFWEFGGWGLRLDIAGRTGVVTRRGPAIRGSTGRRERVLVTVDGADLARRHPQHAGRLNPQRDLTGIDRSVSSGQALG